MVKMRAEHARGGCCKVTQHREYHMYWWTCVAFMQRLLRLRPSSHNPASCICTWQSQSQPIQILLWHFLSTMRCPRGCQASTGPRMRTSTPGLGPSPLVSWSPSALARCFLVWMSQRSRCVPTVLHLSLHLFSPRGRPLQQSCISRRRAPLLPTPPQDRTASPTSIYHWARSRSLAPRAATERVETSAAVFEVLRCSVQISAKGCTPAFAPGAAPQT
jgi:hypothetical protein